MRRVTVYSVTKLGISVGGVGKHARGRTIPCCSTDRDRGRGTSVAVGIAPREIGTTVTRRPRLGDSS